jgi:hypothetical protein
MAGKQIRVICMPVPLPDRAIRIRSCRIEDVAQSFRHALALHSRIGGDPTLALGFRLESWNREGVTSVIGA